MLTILPEKNEDLLDIYKPQTDNAALLVSRNGSEEIGHIATEQRADIIYIIGFHLNGFDLQSKPNFGQHTDADALLRAAGSYALNRAIYIINCEVPEYFTLLRRFGFEETDSYLSISLKQLLKTCKNCR